MATIRKRGELQWQAIVKRKGFPNQVKTWNTRKEAEAWARLIESEMDRGVFVSRAEAEKTTVADLIARYREEELPKKRGNGFGPALKSLEDALGEYSLAGLSSKLIADYKRKRLKTYKDKARTKTYSPDTVRKEINLLSRMINLAGKEWGITLPFNPCTMVSRPPAGKRRDRRLEGDEFVRLLEASKNPHMALMIRFAIATGARLGELLALKWSDVDLKNKVITLRGIQDRGLKNGDDFREAALYPPALDVIAELKGLGEEEEKKEKLPRPADGRVFYWWKVSDSFNKSWQRVCARAGIEDLRFHDLRREAASGMLERGHPPEIVSAQLGHRTPHITLQTYTRLRPREAVKKYQ